ncbi:MAG: hypothetical protein ACK5MJ_04195 [Alphaproteobacteria bacterium]
MSGFYIGLVVIFLIIFILLWLSLKGEPSKKKFIALWAILASFIGGYVFWSYAGIHSRSSFPLQTSTIAKERLPNGKLNMQRRQIIADHQAKRPAIKTVQQPANHPTTTSPSTTQSQAAANTEHDASSASMQQMTNSLEQGLKDGTKSRENWGLLARTQEFQGDYTKAAEALLNGYDAFADKAEIQQEYKDQMAAFIERTKYDGQLLDKLQQIMGQ